MYFNKVVELHNKKDWVGLLNHTIDWTQAHPECADAWYSLGVVYKLNNQPAKEIEVYQKCIDINPAHPEAWNNLGIAYGKLNQPAKEIEAYQRSTFVNPDYVEAWNNLGLTLAKENRPDEAIEAYQQALHINPENASTWYLLGMAYCLFDQTSKTRAMEVYIHLKTLDTARAKMLYSVFEKHGFAFDGNLVKSIHDFLLKNAEAGLITIGFHKLRDQLVLFQRLKQIGKKKGFFCNGRQFLRDEITTNLSSFRSVADLICIHGIHDHKEVFFNALGQEVTANFHLESEIQYNCSSSIKDFISLLSSTL
jgi:tetratricopeptide (TPR) repeat protein